jgi:haloalkane dehalogenase
MMNTFAFLPPTQKRIPWTAFFIRNFGPLSAFAVCGLNLFATGALLLAARKKLSKDVRKAYTAPYNSWKNRIAILKFVQDIPLSPNDGSYPLARFVDDNLHIFSGLPLLICWGERDFVFDQTFLDEWQRRFPEATVHRYPDAGHYVLEDAAADIIPRIQDFLKKHAL